MSLLQAAIFISLLAFVNPVRADLCEIPSNQTIPANSGDFLVTVIMPMQATPEFNTSKAINYLTKEVEMTIESGIKMNPPPLPTLYTAEANLVVKSMAVPLTLKVRRQISGTCAEAGPKSVGPFSIQIRNL